MEPGGSSEVEVVRGGLRLRGTLVLPGMPQGQGEPAPLAILMHGVRAHRNVYRFVSLAAALAERGVASVRFDLNGRGESDGAFEDMTVPAELDDLEAILAWAHGLAQVDAGRLALVGHSQGGVDAALFAARHAGEVAALALLAPATVLEDDCKSGENPFPVGEEYIRTASELHIYETVGVYAGPVCIVHGAKDAIVPLPYAERLAHAYERADLHVFADGDHSLMGEAPEVEDIVVRFVQRHLFPEREAAARRAGFVDMLRCMRRLGQLGNIDDPETPIPPRVREGIGRFGVQDVEL